MPSARLEPASLTARSKDAGEPSWLTDARVEALSSYRALDAPKWRRTDLSALDVEALAIRAASASSSSSRAYARAPGLVHMPLAQAAKEHAELVRELLSAPVADDDKWARLHRALWSDGALLYVERNAQIEAPIPVDEPHGAHGAVRRDVILVDRGASARIVARSHGAAAGAFSMEATEIELRDNASLSLSTVQDLAHQATLLASRRVKLLRDARLTWVDGQLGAGTSVTTNETRLVGTGSSLAFLGAFFGSAGQHLDITTSALHFAPNTSTKMDMKGALSHDGYAVNYSIVNIGPDAKNASGHQHQETLLLSDKARADAIPKLDVENNDVSASHGASVGQVDPEHVFYLETRGFSELAAKRLIVEGFFEPLLAAVPLDDVREQLRAGIAGRLRG